MPTIIHAVFIPIPISEDDEDDEETAMPNYLNQPEPTPASAEVEKKIAAIAEIVGTNPTDPAATLAACEALMGQLAANDAAALRQLSDRERTMLASSPGVSAVAYLARKRANGGVR